MGSGQAPWLEAPQFLGWGVTPQPDSEGQGPSLSPGKETLAQSDAHQDEGERKKQKPQDDERHSIAGGGGVKLT